MKKDFIDLEALKDNLDKAINLVEVGNVLGASHFTEEMYDEIIYTFQKISEVIVEAFKEINKNLNQELKKIK